MYDLFVTNTQIQAISGDFLPSKQTLLTLYAEQTERQLNRQGELIPKTMNSTPFSRYFSGNPPCC